MVAATSCPPWLVPAWARRLGLRQFVACQGTDGDVRVRGIRTLLVLISVVVFGSACSDDESRPAECEEIVEACHDVEPGSGMIHECHENAESKWSKAECVSNRASCLMTCSSADAAARG